MMKPVTLIGAAFSVGGAATGSRRAYSFLRRHIVQPTHKLRWHGVVWQNSTTLQRYPNGLPTIRHSCRQLAHKVQLLRHNHFPVVIGGDHSCAIGTWHGMTLNRAPIGLLWIDAHFDSHTPATSRSQRIHGMPLAVLLGEGNTQLLSPSHPILNPKHTVVFGVHSFEAGEPELLQRHGIRVYTMAEIRRRGLHCCLSEAWKTVAACPQGFGISLDLDSIDPQYAPAVSVAEPAGLPLPLLLSSLARQPKRRLLALEIAEFNPYLEHHRRTLKALTTLIVTLTTRVKRLS